MSEVPELLTVEEVARRLRVARSTVSRWATNGVLDAVRVGGTVRFRADEIDALINRAPETIGA